MTFQFLKAQVAGSFIGGLTVWFGVFFSATHFSFPIQNNAWELQKEKNGIQIFSRKHVDGKSRQIKSVITATASLSCMTAIIRDSEGATEWVNRMKIFKDLKVINDTVWYTYSEVEIPFPFKNKDFITRNVISQDKKTKIVTIAIKSVPDFIPEKEGKSRIRKSEGFWQFKPMGLGKTEITYTFYAEQDGSLPAWFVNPIVVNSVYDTMLGLQKMYGKKQYQDAKMNFISDVTQR